MPHIPPDSHAEDRRYSIGTPDSAVDIHGPVGPDFERPKHKSATTGLTPSDIRGVEASIPEPQREAWRKYVCPSPGSSLWPFLS